MAAGIALSCEGLSKSFDLLNGGSVWRLVLGRASPDSRFRALDDVTLEVPKGRFVGVVGRNGAGKSTLLRTLGGVYTPDAGTVKVDGDLSGLYELGLTGHRDLTGREYADRVLGILRTPRKGVGEAVEEIRDFSELGERFDDPLYTYSAGMSARLFFATATAKQHDLYLIDEVLSVGDEHFQQKCWRRIRERLDAGASGLLVTHDWSAVLKLCETAHVLDRGRVTLSGRADTVVTRYLDTRNLFPRRQGVARLVEPLAEDLVWSAGEDARLTVDVEVLADGVLVCLVYAIERMTVGVGWEIVLNSDDLPIADRQGRYRVEITLPALPLTPGPYQLTIDAMHVNPRDRRDRTCLDGRGWLKGTPIRLRVDGSASHGQLRLPLEWRLATK